MAERFLEQLITEEKEESGFREDIKETARKLLQAATPCIEELCSIFQVPRPRIKLYFRTLHGEQIDGRYDYKQNIIRIWVGVEELVDEWHYELNRRLFSEVFINCLFHELWHYIFYQRFQPTEEMMEIIGSIHEESARRFGYEMQKKYEKEILRRAGLEHLLSVEPKL